MTRKLLMIILAFSLAACTPAGAAVQVLQSAVQYDTRPQVAQSELQQVSQGTNQFTLDLYHQLNAGSGNLFLSPYSAAVALAMTYAGARGDTASQMASALHFSLPQEKLHAAFNALALELQSRANVEGLKADETFQLNIANSLWGQQGFPFQADFLDLLARNYAAGLRLVDFEKDAEGARQAINSWASDATAQRIRDLLPQGSVDALTRLVLANAIYFKATWMDHFEASATQPADFHKLDGSIVSVPMMHRNAHMSYAENDQVQLVELPYAGGQVSMFVLLPKTENFIGVDQSLTSDQLDKLISSMQPMQVELSLPKFKIESTASLPDALAVLGMKDAFDANKADFSGMDGAKDLYISGVFHKAFVAVDENGTEAAAATAVVVGTTAMPMPLNPATFNADHPFLFFIRDNPTGTILFLGRVMDAGVN